MKHWIVGLVLLTILISIVGAKIYIESQNKIPPPGWALLHSPNAYFDNVIGDNLTLKQGESKEVYLVLDTSSCPRPDEKLPYELNKYYPGKVRFEVWRVRVHGSYDEIPMPEGLKVTKPPEFVAEAREIYKSKFTFEADPDLLPDEYVLLIQLEWENRLLSNQWLSVNVRMDV